MSKYSKALIAIVGTILTLIVASSLPDQWKIAAGGILTVLTGLGVYTSPYHGKYRQEDKSNDT